MGNSNFEYRTVEYNHSNVPLKAETYFDTQYDEPDVSPIDTFQEKTRELNKLIVKPDELPSHLSNLLLLGYVSAVESYIRKLLRRLIITDEASKKASKNCTLTYAAATSYDREMLPESLMENYTFTTAGVIQEAIKNLLGIKKNKYFREVEGTLAQYSKVCQLRHCIVHRFGHLGSENAIRLDLGDHKELLNKPVKLDFDSLQNVLLVCSNTVKVLNNFLFREILTRTVDREGRYWEWEYNSDKEKFKEFFAIFYSRELSGEDFEQACANAYRAFKEAMEK